MSKLFRNVRTGAIEEVFNPMVIEQYEKRPELYAPMKNKNEETGLSYKELKAQAKDLGLEFAGNISKDDLEKLIAENQE